MPTVAAGEDTFSITTATFTDLSQTGPSSLTQPAARTTPRTIPSETLVGQQPLSRLVDTMFMADASDSMANDPIQSATAPSHSGSPIQVIDSLFAVVDRGWDFDSEDRMLEQSDAADDSEALHWTADEAFDEWLG